MMGTDHLINDKSIIWLLQENYVKTNAINFLVHKMSYIGEGQHSHLEIRELRVNS